MRESIDQLLEQGRYFMPHGHCYLWIPSLLWLHVGSDLLIGFAYLGISLLLWRLVRKLRLPFSPVFLAFGLFIGLCGGTHFMEVWTTWNPDYLASGLLKAATAAASVATAIGLLYVKPQVEEVVHAARLSEERRVRLESTHAELEALYRRVTELDELKSRFFANVSHELRTPLALILGPLEQMADDPALPPEQRRRLASMKLPAQSLLKQINDLLDIARLEAGRATLHYSRFDLVPWLRRTTGVFEDLARQRGLRLSLDTPEQAPVEADPEKLERVLVNLLGNALKFTPSGGAVAVSLRLAGEEEVVLEVADTGPGVPPALREVVFERFRQADDSATRRHGGTGLGLAITRDFVTLHQGSVAVEAAPGGGALLRVRLPRHAPAGTPVDDSGSWQPGGRGAEAEQALQGVLAELAPPESGEAAVTAAPADPDAATVLVVEDHPAMRAFVAATLAPVFRVHTAADGSEGLAKAQALRPDLVVSDLMMPGMSGDRLLEALRARPALDTTPVLLLTARTDESLRARLLQDGAQDYLVKPFAPAELLARARNLVTFKRTGDLLRRSLDSASNDLETLGRELARRQQQLQTALDTTAVAREQAERASQVKTTFLGMISHELRTPLSTIHLNLQLLLRDRQHPLPEPLLPRVERLRNAARQMGTLVESLLEYTRLDSGRLQLQPQTVDLGQLARDTVEEFRPQAAGQSPGLALQAPEGSAVAHTDPRLLKVVLSNLLANALKFTREGRIAVHVRADARQALLEVEDSGIGIAAEDLDRIFLPFESLEPLHRKTVPGVGLGLSLVQHIVHALGGDIHVRSQPGVGSVFSVVLPAQATQAVDAA